MLILLISGRDLGELALSFLDAQERHNLGVLNWGFGITLSLLIDNRSVNITQEHRLAERRLDGIHLLALFVNIPQ